ncbi:MAG: DNA-binding NarL/FixJ family response regulator [Rhodothermales bacterium]
MEAGFIAESTLFLTPREREVLQLVVDGQSNDKIADALYISKQTVETHRKNIFAKTAAGSLVDLVHFARDNGCSPRPFKHSLRPVYCGSQELNTSP